MNLLDLVQRAKHPEPWAEGDNIPWHAPAFSERMLREHLSQSHDAASRRSEIIRQHVQWLHNDVLHGQPSRILDLGCGPGLYCRELALLGHTCVGVDYAPASIRHAREITQGLPCTFIFGDLREADFGSGFDLAMQIYGEINIFKPADARLILRKAHAALNAGGMLLLEAHTQDVVQRMGHEPASWSSHERGLFGDAPYLYLRESDWDEPAQVATHRHIIVDAASAEVTRYASSIQAYDDAGYRALLHDAGFDEVRFLPSLAPDAGTSQSDFIVLMASCPHPTSPV
jgi:SAM-dependent methyltransferase